MTKFKELAAGFSLVVVTSFIWLVSSCSRSTVSSVPIVSSTSNNSTQPGNSVDLFSVYNVNMTNYHLGINGMVKTPLSLSYEQIQAYPAVTEKVELFCDATGVASDGWIDENDQWTGVLLSILLKEAGVMPGASEVVFTGVEGYQVRLTLKSVLQNGVFLAYKINGQMLPPKRGYPLRLVASESLGKDWLKWVTNIEVTSATVSLINSSSIIQNLSNNVPLSGRKLCSCLLLAVKGLSKSVN